jgi:hypothetical protein
MSWCLRGRGLPATPALIGLMSLRLVIPGGLLSSRARFRFTNRSLLCDNRFANCKKAFAWNTDPTLTRCLTFGAHPRLWCAFCRLEHQEPTSDEVGMRREAESTLETRIIAIANDGLLVSYPADPQLYLPYPCPEDNQ